MHKGIIARKGDEGSQLKCLKLLWNVRKMGHWERLNWANFGNGKHWNNLLFKRIVSGRVTKKLVLLGD